MVFQSSALISRELREKLLQLAAVSPDEEICGFIGGCENRLLHHYPVANIAQDRKRFFEMDARGQLDAMREIERHGQQLLGIYHSHLSSPAYPSATDIQRHAYPDLLFAIISITQPQASRLRAFLIRKNIVKELKLVYE